MPILTLSPISPADPARIMRVARQPKRALLAKVEAIERTIDPERLGEPARTSREIPQGLDASIPPHDGQAFDGFERPNQDAGADSGRLARHIQHEGDAVGEVNVGMSALEKQRAIARRHAPVGVPGGVADTIGLGLDDAAARRAFGQLPHEELANEKAGERGRVDRQRRAEARPCRRPGSHPLDQMRARRPGLERIAEILRLAGDLAVAELHDADRVGRPPVIGAERIR